MLSIFRITLLFLTYANNRACFGAVIILSVKVRQIKLAITVNIVHWCGPSSKSDLSPELYNVGYNVSTEISSRIHKNTTKPHW